MATITLTYSYEKGDLIAIWGHSPGVTSEDYENDNSIDPYYVHEEYTATQSGSNRYIFSYDETRGYVAAIYINGNLENHSDIAPTAIVFNWDTNITAGAEMAVVGNLTFAPVTADEWNRLVNIVNTKKGTNYKHVSRGEDFSASNGSSVKTIADALGVSVSSSSFISAEFFHKLRDAVNAL